MRFPLTADVLEEVDRFALRSACVHCYFELPDGSCGLGWPNDEQRRWPPDAPAPGGEIPEEIAFCKEFELR